MSDGAEQKPKASTLERMVYWAKRDGLERTIADLEQSNVLAPPGRPDRFALEDVALFRERLTALGDPPGPRVREEDDRRRERIARAALTGLLANPSLGSPSFAKYALREADDLIALLDAEDAAP